MSSQPKLRKFGRPTLPAGQGKTGSIQVRLNADDRKRVEMAAQANGETISDWMRRLVMDFDVSAGDWNRVKAIFGRARTAYELIGDTTRARACDDAIALVDTIALDPRL